MTLIPNALTSYAKLSCRRRARDRRAIAGATLASVRDALGADATVLESDAASRESIDALAIAACEELGGFDALMICVGQTRFVPFEPASEDVYNQLFAVNTKGPYFTVQKLAPLIAEGGAVVMITSVANARGNPIISSYAASKAALRLMVRSVARELLPRGRRVNAVSRVPSTAEFWKGRARPKAAEKIRQQMTERNQMGRFGKPDEVARAMVLLAFEASYTTGAELVLDGCGTQL